MISYWNSNQSRIVNIAHRGGGSLGPENTLAAALKGLACGADAWELDVQQTADGKLVVMHDDTPKRTSDVNRVFPGREDDRVYEYTLEELSRLDVGSWYADSDPFGEIEKGNIGSDEAQTWRGLRILTFREALEFSISHRRPVVVEIKDHHGMPGGMPGEWAFVDRVLHEIRDAGAGDLVLISSFRHDYLKAVRESALKLPTAAVVGRIYDDPVSLMKELDALAYYPRFNEVTPEQIDELIRSGAIVICWTPNDPEEMEALIGYGVSGILTDYPQTFAALLEAIS